MTYLIDTAKAIDQIESAGLSREQASAIVNTFADVGEQFATKADIERLQTYLEALDGKVETLDGKVETLDGKVETLRVELRAEMKSNSESLRAEMKSDSESLRAEMKSDSESLKNYLLYRMVLLQIAGIGVLFTLLKFLAN